MLNPNGTSDNCHLYSFDSDHLNWKTKSVCFFRANHTCVAYVHRRKRQLYTRHLFNTSPTVTIIRGHVSRQFKNVSREECVRTKLPPHRSLLLD